ncbi:methyltransferase small, partial [mine drainage metagenome]
PLRETDRVLDMGTGSGVNGIIATSKSRQVVAVDVNPIAVECAKQNAERNCVGERVEVRESDLFQNVSGRFDLILFDPPFRWFHPRDFYERATADENYETLTSFFQEVHSYLTESGRILLSFGTTGDIDYLHELVARAGLQTEEMRRVEGEKDGLAVAYIVYRFTMPSRHI